MGQCTTTGPTTTTVQSSKQLIKKFWHMVQSTILKKSNFGPNLTFRPPWGLGKFSQRQNIHIRKCLISVKLHAKNKKNVSHGSEDILEKVNFGSKI